MPLAVDGHDPVGDVGENGDAPLLLERDPLVELGAGKGGRGVPGEGAERLDLLLTPLARLPRVDGEHAVDRPLGADERDAEVARVARAQDGIGLEQALVLARVRHRNRCAGLDGVAGQACRRGKPALEGDAGRLAADRAGDELVSLEQAQYGGVGQQQLGRPLRDLVQQRGRVELRGEQAARPRELLRERARPPLALEKVTALQRPSGGAGQVAGELEVVVGETVLLGEEDEHERGVVLARRLDRRGQQRLVAGLLGHAPPRRPKAVVICQRRRDER